jgi:hypothetical protein
MAHPMGEPAPVRLLTSAGLDKCPRAGLDWPVGRRVRLAGRLPPGASDDTQGGPA